MINDLYAVINVLIVFIIIKNLLQLWVNYDHKKKYHLTKNNHLGNSLKHLFLISWHNKCLPYEQLMTIEVIRVMSDQKIRHKKKRKYKFLFPLFAKEQEMKRKVQACLLEEHTPGVLSLVSHEHCDNSKRQWKNMKSLIIKGGHQEKCLQAPYSFSLHILYLSVLVLQVGLNGNNLLFDGLTNAILLDLSLAKES